MSVDFTALTQAVVAGVADVRACVVVSRDGLALGATPETEERKALAAWARISSLGEVERGFVAMHEATWVFCKRGPYAALATTRPSVRPGLVLDLLEQVLLTAEEARGRKDAIRPSPERDPAPQDPSRRMRTPLHAEPRTSPIGSQAPGERAESSGGKRDVEEPVPAEDGARPGEARRDQPEDGKGRGEDRKSRDQDLGWSVDRASLSREFAGLLMEHDEEEEE